MNWDTLAQFLANAGISIASMLLMGLALTIYMSASRIFHVGLGASYCLSAYIFLFTYGHASLPVAAAAGLLGAVAVGIVVGKYVYEPLSERGATSSGLLLASLACYLFAEGAIRLLWGTAAHSLPRAGPSIKATFCGISLPVEHWTQLIVALVSVAVCWLILRFTNAGLRLRAVMASLELARLYRIRVPEVLLFTLTISSGLAGVAGTLAVFVGDVTPTMGLSVLLAGTAAAVIGGLGSPAGVVLGATCVAVIEQIVGLILGNEWKGLVLALLAAGMFFWRPHGLLGVGALEGR